MKGKLMSFYPAYLICLVLTFIAVNVTRYICHVDPYLKGLSSGDKHSKPVYQLRQNAL